MGTRVNAAKVKEKAFRIKEFDEYQLNTIGYVKYKIRSEALFYAIDIYGKNGLMFKPRFTLLDRYTLDNKINLIKEELCPKEKLKN